MQKSIFSLLIFLIFLTTQTLAQANKFKIYTFPGCWGGEAREYISTKNTFEFISILTHGSIAAQGSGDTVLSKSAVKRKLAKLYPDPKSTDIVLLDWEGKLFKYLRNLSPTDARFKYSEGQYLELIKTVKAFRPNLKVAVYGLPYKFFSSEQKSKSTNYPGKLNTVLAQVDIISPTFYLNSPDEKVTHARNIRFLKENLDEALSYGKRHNKLVMPLVWHRIHPTNKKYSRALIQPEVFSSYVSYIYSYSQNNYKVSGIMWWDDMKQSNRMKNLNGLSNWTQGKVTDMPTYNAMMINYANTVLQALPNLSKL